MPILEKKKTFLQKNASDVIVEPGITNKLIKYINI